MNMLTIKQVKKDVKHDKYSIMAADIKLILSLLFGMAFFIYCVWSVIYPFIFALIIASFCSTIMGKLELCRLPRWLSALIVVSAILFVLVFLLYAIVPMLYGHANHLFFYLSDNAGSISLFVSKEGAKYVQYLPTALQESFLAAITDISGLAVKLALPFSKNLLYSGIFLVNMLFGTFLTALVTFYLLKDWIIFRNNIIGLIPVRYRYDLMELLLKIKHDTILCVSLQLAVCCFMSCFYSVALYICDIENGVALGIIGGICGLIPYIGVIFAVTIGALTSFANTQDCSQFAVILAIFFAGSFVDGNFLTPKLIGDTMGMHPVLIMLGFLCFGYIFGVMGVIAALPLTITFGIITRFIFHKYGAIHSFRK